MKKGNSQHLNLAEVDSGEVMNQDDAEQIAGVVVSLFLEQLFDKTKDQPLKRCEKDER
jgi:hypothetical protein